MAQYHPAAVSYFLCTHYSAEKPQCFYCYKCPGGLAIRKDANGLWTALCSMGMSSCSIVQLGITADCKQYMGAPLTTSDGQNIGALCVLDTSAERPLPTEKQQQGLLDLANLVMRELDYRSE